MRRPRENLKNVLWMACMAFFLGCSGKSHGISLDGAVAVPRVSDAAVLEASTGESIDTATAPEGGRVSAPCEPGPGGCWVPFAMNGAPQARADFALAWTGQELLVWGGIRATLEGELRSGGAYALASGTWRPMSITNGLSPRIDPCFAWTGTMMWNWGGFNVDGDIPSTRVSIYDPVTDAWSFPASRGDEPVARAYTKVVWTGREVLVWGGLAQGENALGSGSRYDLASATWSAMSEVGAPVPRWQHLVAWTGTRMLVWGGRFETVEPAESGGIYDPSTDQWTPMASEQSVTAHEPAGIWTGRELFVWGDTLPGLYDPETNRWRSVSMTGAPSSRRQPMVVWTGRFVVVWGGSSNRTPLGDGGLYNPASDVWTPMSTQNAPAPRLGPAIWADSENAMLLWGGIDSQSTRNDGAAFYAPMGDGRPLDP